jgi:putative phosphoribosyl transferase
MLIFQNRKDAGKQLAQALKLYTNELETVVIALPRGGVIVGYEVASELGLPLDIVCPRKIGAPFNPELAIGAITETGEGILSEDLIVSFSISADFLKKTMQKEKEKAQWRLEHYRQHRPARVLKDKRIILIDDGIATGSTMKAAIKTIRAERARELILAVPVAPPDTLRAIQPLVDHLICLSSPSNFYSVGQFYNDFDQTTDEEVIDLLSQKANS